MPSGTMPGDKLASAQGHASAAVLYAGFGDYETTSCPACGETNGENIFGEVCEGVSIQLLVCKRCSLGYSTPRPSESFKLRRYEAWAAQERPWKAEAHFDHRQQLRHFHLYRRVMELIVERMPSGRILDVGVGGGLFLVFAGVYASDDHTGINSRYRADGAAFDPHECELAHRVSGSPVMMVSDLSAMPAAKYDAITLLNVLEHVNRPVELLGQLRRLLRPGGPLIVESPNNELAFWRMKHRIGAARKSLACHEHILHFRKRSLEKLLNGAGFGGVQFLPPVAAESSGSIVRPSAREWAKHGVCRALDLLTGSRCYLYAEILAVAE